MAIRHQLRDNVLDIPAFGFGVLTRLLGRFAGDRIHTTHLRGVGRVSMRPRSSDIACIRQVFRSREYSFADLPQVDGRIRARYERLVADGETPVIIDGGANIGAASLWFSQRYPAAKVVAVEPDPDNFDVLERNTRGNGNLVALRAALGAEPGFAEIRNPGAGWAVQTARAERGLPIVTVDGAVEAAGGGRLFVVKIDIEGFERDLFSSNLAWIEQAYVVVIEPHDWMLPGQFTSAPFMKALAEHRFEVFIQGENLTFVRE